MQRVLVRYGRGPAWDGGPLEEQPGWEGHVDFVTGLVRQGLAVMGGELADRSGAVLLLENVDAEEAFDLVDADPFVASRVFTIEDVHEWTLRFDVTRAPEPG